MDPKFNDSDFQNNFKHFLENPEFVEVNESKLKDIWHTTNIKSKSNIPRKRRSKLNRILNRYIKVHFLRYVNSQRYHRMSQRLCPSGNLKIVKKLKKRSMIGQLDIAGILVSPTVMSLLTLVQDLTSIVRRTTSNEL